MFQTRHSAPEWFELGELTLPPRVRNSFGLARLSKNVVPGAATVRVTGTVIEVRP